MEGNKILFLIVTREDYLNSSWIDVVDDPRNPQYYGEKIEEYDGEWFVKYDSPFTYEQIKENHTTRSLIEVGEQELPFFLEMINGVNYNGVEGCTTYIYAYKVKWEDFDLEEEVGFDKNDIVLEHCQVWYNGAIYEINHNKRRGIGSMDAWRTWKEFEIPENEIHALQN